MDNLFGLVFKIPSSASLIARYILILAKQTKGPLYCVHLKLHRLMRIAFLLNEKLCAYIYAILDEYDINLRYGFLTLLFIIKSMSQNQLMDLLEKK